MVESFSLSAAGDKGFDAKNPTVNRAARNSVTEEPEDQPPSDQDSGAQSDLDSTNPNGDTFAYTSSETERTPGSLIGSRLGDYQVLRKLGRGGMADVFAARQLSLGRDVALKVLRSEYARDKDYVERFRREARAAAKLNHPNIVQVYEVGSIDSVFYIAQELIDGGNLRQRLEDQGAIGAEEAIELLVGVASALELAAEAGITHRDIKPENIMRSTRGIIKVADFGLARISTDMSASQTSLTQAGLTLGTPRYMSPEQVQGHAVDARSDLYSLGVTMYHLLAGRPPFEADDPLALALMQLQETPTPLDRARAKRAPDGQPDLPEWLIAVVTRLMNKSPQDRFQSPSELLDAVHNEAAISTISGLGVGTAAATIRLQRAADESRRVTMRRRMQFLAGVLLPLLITLYAGWRFEALGGPSVSRLLNPETVAGEESVQEQYLKAVDRNDEAGWRAVSQYFPPETGTINAGYHAKSRIQLAAMFASQGRYEEAEEVLSELLRHPSLDSVYRTIALARRCINLEQWEKNNEAAEVRRELQSVYQELSAENTEGRQFVDRVFTQSEKLLLGLIDS
ncbi:MAG: serine/threonine-protein kinase [Rubripirellula sp.]